MNARSILDHWHDTGALDQQGYRQALRALHLAPDAARWRQLAARLLLIGGVLCVLAGTLMLFASNWLAWPRLARVGAAETGWLALLVWAFMTRPDNQARRWALFAVATMTGIWLAVIGQAYQTGADAWQLFALWAALALPWALLANFAPLWGLWIVIVSLALQLWLPHAPWRSALSAWDPFDNANLPLIGFWLAALAVAEWRQNAAAPWTARILPRLLGLGLALLLTIQACMILAGEHLHAFGEYSPTTNGLVLLLWLACVGAALYFYSLRRDLLMLALPLFSVWVAVLAWIANFTHDSGWLYPTALLAIGGLGGIAWWLHARHRQWQTASRSALQELAP
ncbi:hypothetical protein CAter282_2561 [Collimonas arenae]|uniref:DUF2157 domain-containing protein n=1 Tax=Collimonas arenae TaxID=279058 RepID=A0A127PRR2_9BURK|nr:DUF2157 domain-containing protein [Collimonas arenae]AMP00419.1 hypothetical protein CAter10_2823 [Collimonas arenae]AMP10298.1 hypothetical protein CAter282_2561 [Collimonas arenae]